MSLQMIEMNGSKIIFDREKTKDHRTEFNQPCDCQDCRNYYKHIENNQALVAFLDGFGVDFHCAEEVFSWELKKDETSLLHYEGYYGVFGTIEGEAFETEMYGVKITFQKGAPVPCDREGAYFWICIEGAFAYILDEDRELPTAFSQGLERLAFIRKIITRFKKK
jgi:hypothetical protein